MSDIEANKIRNADLSADLVHDLIKERSRERRWKNIRFFLVFFVIVVIAALLGWSKPNDNTKRIGTADGQGYIALIDIDGLISSSDSLLPRLRQAFADKQAKGIILDINSPGGTPVQASIIHDEILKLKTKFKKKVVVVGEDMLTSGAYYIAVSADKIYVNPNTIVGSIGVVMEGFGFNDLLKKVGVDRRAIFSGENKDRLDPFMPEKALDVEKMKVLLEQVHNNFNQAVKEGRHGKLKGDEKSLFSGDFWNGDIAIQLGLVDDLGNLSDVMQKEFNVSRYKNLSSSNSVLMSMLGQVSSTFNLPLASQSLHLMEKL